MIPRATAQEGATFAIAVYSCPPGFEGTGQAYLDCTDRPTADVAVQLIDIDDTTNTVTQTTGADGGTEFDLSRFSPGQIAVFVEQTVFPNPPALFCSTNAGGATEQPVEVVQRDPGPDAARFVIEPQAGDRIGCDFYVVPPAGQPTPAPTAPAGEDATVTIYSTACPPGYAGTAYFEDCFDNPQEGVEYFLARGGGGVAGTTGPEGFATIVLPGDVLPGLVTAQQETPAGFAEDFFVYCTMDDGATLLDVEQSTGEPGPDGSTTFFASFEVAPGDEIRCDWYNVPPAQETPTPAPPAPTQPAPTPTPDPDARPAAIREGDCDDEALGDVVVELTGVSQPEGETVGQDDAILAATSFSIVDRSLEEILAADHVVTIGEPAGAAGDDPVVCGEIGGVLDGNGDLVIGLAERGDSGYTGIAFLAPDATDAGQTEISVFIAEVVDEDEAGGIEIDEEDVDVTPAA